MMKYAKQFWPLIALIVISASIYFSGLGQYLSFSAVQERREDILQSVEENFIFSAGVYFLIYMSLVALSLPFATVMTLLGGFLFGAVTGTLLVVSAATLGACIIFLIARTSLGAFLREKAGDYHKRTQKEFEQNGFQYLLFLRLAPIFPFAIVNILPALFNMDFRKYAIATFFGIMPGSFVYVYAGRSLATIDKPADFVSPQILTAFFLLSSLALIPVILKKLKGRKLEPK
jgi:uncharacterized membrane protein YdjX (TVP38/TMEM64 family)